MTVLDQLDSLAHTIRGLRAVHPMGRVAAVRGGVLVLDGLTAEARIGQQINVRRADMPPLRGEIVQLQQDHIIALPAHTPQNVSAGDRATLHPVISLSPDDSWLGKVIDPLGKTLAGAPLLRGNADRDLNAPPPSAARRRPMGARMETGLAITNTMLPLVAGQRIGLFAGAGVGKSSLLGSLARGVAADVVVIALIGERGHEVRHFVDHVLGDTAMRRSVIVAATSDQSALERRRCAWSAMAVAEHFRDQGKSVLLLADSITRFAEAHREIAIAAGEPPVLRGYPPSVNSLITGLCERAGPGEDGQGDITAIFSVLVAGSDMDEPIADLLRGVLDGHVILSRDISERGRFPAIDVLRSVSRSLPGAASAEENQMIANLRSLIAVYEENAAMIRAGLYAKGSDPKLDQAIAVWSEIETFLARPEPGTCADSFQQLELILRRAASQTPRGTRS